MRQGMGKKGPNCHLAKDFTEKNETSNDFSGLDTLKQGREQIRKKGGLLRESWLSSSSSEPRLF